MSELETKRSEITRQDIHAFALELLDGCLDEEQLKRSASSLGLTKLPNLAITIFINPLEKLNSLIETDQITELKIKTLEMFKYWEGAIVLQYRGKVVIMLPRSYRDFDLMKSEIREKLAQVIDYFSSGYKTNLTLLAGVGQYYDSPSMVHLSYSESCCAAQSYFLQGSRVIFFESLDENRDLSDSLYMYDDEKKLLEKVGIGDIQSAREKLNEMVKSFGNASSEDFLNNLFVFLFEQMVILTRGVLSEGADPQEVSDIKRKLTKKLIKVKDIPTMENWIDSMIESLILSIRKKVKKPSAWIVKEAEEYINSNYQHYLTLDLVADKVHVSPAYLSRIFKEEKNESFVRYLNKIRMIKAKQLLSKTQLDIGEVAVKVGFRNQNYFTTVFRKKEGMTPSDFRNKLEA